MVGYNFAVVQAMPLLPRLNVASMIPVFFLFRETYSDAATAALDVTPALICCQLGPGTASVSLTGISASI